MTTITQTITTTMSMPTMTFTATTMTTTMATTTTTTTTSKTTKTKTMTATKATTMTMTTTMTNSFFQIFEFASDSQFSFQIFWVTQPERLKGDKVKRPKWPPTRAEAGAGRAPRLLVVIIFGNHALFIEGPRNFVGAADDGELKRECPLECRPPEHPDWLQC